MACFLNKSGLINKPIFIGGSGEMPPARAVNYLCWCAVGIFFNFYVFRRYKGWWARHNYILSAGLDAGVAFMAMLCYFTLRIRHINGMRWWGLELDDHCPLASCPTAPAPWSRGWRVSCIPLIVLYYVDLCGYNV